MADQPQSASDVFEIVKQNDVRFVRFWFTDILGQLKSFSINSAELEDAFEGGMGFDGSSITGFNPIEESDMIAMPDPSTFAVLPWRPAENATGRMFCDVQVPGGEPYEGDPRWILRRALKRASDMGFDTYNIGPELEYFYFRSAKPEDGPPEILDEGGYFDLTTLDAGSDVRRETILALEQLGIHVEYAHHEVGPSQHEVDMRYKDALAMSDDCMTYRIVVKEYAMKYGWHATFMPKPLYGENGSGMHGHQALSRDGRNAFYDADDQYYLSPTAKAFIDERLGGWRQVVLVVGVVERVPAVPGQCLVAVHPRPVLAIKRLRHERRVPPVLHRVLLDHDPVRHAVVGHRERILVAHVHLVLGRADLVVGVLAVDAGLLEPRDRLAAHVGAGVERRQVEVAAFVQRLGLAVLRL